MVSRARPASAAIAIGLLLACEEPSRVAGGASETEATVAGRVERADGSPVAGAAVRLRPAAFLSDTGAAPLRKGMAKVLADAVTGADGAFRFDSVFLGDYAIEAGNATAGARLFASVGGMRSRTETGPAVVAPLGHVRGRIVPPAGAQANGYVRVYGLERAAKADSSGRFDLAGLPAGVFDLRVTPTSPSISARSLLGIVLPPGADLELGDISLAPTLDAEDYSTWGDSARIRINTLAAGVSGSVAAFPLLVRLDRSNFDFTASTGLDLRVADGRGKPLPYELERWDPLLGKAELWVRADSLSGPDSAQYLTLHWNRPGARGRSDGAAVFDAGAGYRGAWHLARPAGETGAVFRDASGQGNDAVGDGLDSSASSEGISHVGQALDGIEQAIHTSQAFPGPDTFTVSLWFKSTATVGGKLMGFGGWQTGASIQNDRHVWMDVQGRIRFGVFPATDGPNKGETRILATGTAYNDGAWHHVAARLSAEGQALFLDGVKVASDPATTTGFPYSGFWRVGYDNFGAWDDRPTNYHFRGSLDEIRVAHAAWSDDFIRLSYATQKPGSGIVSLGR